MSLRKNFLSASTSQGSLHLRFSEKGAAERASPVVVLEPPLQTHPVEEMPAVELAHLLLRLEPAQAHAAAANALVRRHFGAHRLELLHADPRCSFVARRGIAGFGFGFGLDTACDDLQDVSPGALHARHREGRVHHEERQDPFCCYREARQPHLFWYFAYFFSTPMEVKTCSTLQSGEEEEEDEEDSPRRQESGSRVGHKWPRFPTATYGSGHVATRVRTAHDSGMYWQRPKTVCAFRP
ncbi:uncharacterized protein J3R85_006400 [Psidium guajava]|nr:uncharacterized protein J3R85_006400 [Psidium guajava]